MFIENLVWGGASLDEAVESPPAASHVVFLAGDGRQAEAAPHGARGTMEFVQKLGEYFGLVTALIERNLQGCPPVEWLPLPYGLESADDLSAIFRHEINNPLTGILGDAELLLAHRHQLPPSETQRLETIVELAVGLRETIRRLSNEWEAGVHTAHIQSFSRPARTAPLRCCNPAARAPMIWARRIRGCPHRIAIGQSSAA